MLVHICCAVDSHYFLRRLREEYPDEELTGFFYDPNIHPYNEYLLRLLEVRRSCDLLGIRLIEGPYDADRWFRSVRGLEHEPEKGRRCTLCFDLRFEASARKAAQLGERSFTSTLLISPKKSLEQLRGEGERIARKHGVEFVAPDYRKASGTQEQNRLARADRLYRQDYCGCLYALSAQRRQQGRPEDELFSPISRQIQPESVEERLRLYRRRLELEKRGIPYRIVKERFLNWRLRFALLLVRGKPVASHILPYSTLRGNYTRGKVETDSGIPACLNRDEVKLLRLEDYNRLAGTSYRNLRELIRNPPPFENETELRRKVLPSPYDLSALIVVESIPDGKIELRMDSVCYEDVRERLITEETP